MYMYIYIYIHTHKYIMYMFLLFATRAFLGHCSGSGLKPRGVTSAQRLT